MQTRPRVASFGVPKRRFATVLSLAVTLAIGSLSFIPASAAQAAGSPAADPKQPSTPVSKVKAKKSAGREMPEWTGRKAVWPSAASADLDLPLLSTGGRAAAKALVGGLPVTVSAPTPDADPAGGDTQSSKILADLAAGRGAPAKVRVQTLDRASAKAADAAAAVRITRADGRAERAPIRVEIDYSAFANAYGADWANRARLVLLPECAPDEPAAAACAPRALHTTRDAANGVLTADVELTAAPETTGTGGQGGGAGATEATDLQGNPVTLAAAPAAAPTSAVVALAAGAASETGDFTQTPLSRTATWNAGGSAGGFSWNYPITVPPAPGDLAPEVSLGYSSASVDGQTAGKNTQPSWIGEGWDYHPGFIERVYRPCNQDTDNSPHWTAANNLGDQCWRLPNAKIVWNGKSTELIPEDASAAPNTAVPAVWRMADDDGTKVEYLADTGTATTLNWHNERWRVTTKDGTQYYFGMSLVPGTTTRTNSVLGEPIVSNHSGEPCFSSTALTSSWCVMAYRWNLDYVVDPQGNSMVYYYTKEFNKTSPAGSTAVGYDRSAYLTRIDYGMRAGTEGTVTAPARVLFNTADRCFTTSCATHDGANWPDTPWDLNCTGTSCPPASFWSTKRLSSIDAQVWTGSGTTYRSVDSYDLSMNFPDPNDPDNVQTPVLWLRNITRTASDSGTGISGGSVTMPSVVFYGTSMQNRALFTSTSGAPESWKYRITTIDTESGEEIKPTYSAMDSGCVKPAADPNPDANTKRCFPQRYEDAWTWWHKYVVDKVTDTDTSGGSPDIVHAYTYATSASVGGKTIGSNTNVLWKHDLTGFGTKMENRSWGDWVGYPVVTEVVGAAGGTQSKTTRVYFRGLHGDRIDQTDVDGTTRTATITDTDHAAGTDYAYRAGFLKEEITFDGNTGTVLNKTFNDPLSVQTGTRTLPTTWAKSVPLEAWRTDDGWSKTMTWLAASSAWRTSQKTYTYDTFGNVATVHDQGDTGKSDDDTCTTNTYVTNTTANLRRYDGTGPSALSANPSVVYPDWAGTDKAFSPGDFNGDGKKDLISRSGTSGRLYLNPGNGDGTFGAGVQIGTGWAGYRDVFSPGDFNGDGKSDVLGSKPDGTLWLWPGNGTGGFGTAAQIGTTSWEQYDLFSVGDWTGDGKGDVLGARLSDGALVMWTGTGSGTVNSAVQIGTSGWTSFTDLLGYGDITGDGKSDIIGADTAGLWVYPGNAVAAGSMGARYRLATGLIGTDSNMLVATGDITGDGKADLLARQFRYIADALSTTATVGVACGTTPSYPGDAVSASRYYYDQPGAPSPSLSALPIAGALTRTEQAKDYTGSNPNWITTGQTTAFDAYGRPATVKDGLGRSTSTAYTMTNGLTTAVTVTPPPGSAYNTVTTLAPGRGLPVTVTDANSKMTTKHHDAAGRLIKGWQPGHSTSGTPDTEYIYSLSSTPTTPSYVTTKTMGPNGQQVTSYQILDSLLRERQSQTPTADGGRTVSDIRYDSRGNVVKTSKTYNSSAASATLVAFPDESTISQQHRLTIDGLGRITTDELWSNGVKKQTTTTTHDGDRVTIDLPTGGIDTTTVTDVDGNTVELRQYKAGNASGDYDATKYQYDDANQLVRVTDPADNRFDYGYDLLGRRTTMTDPDSGTATSTYDDAGQIIGTRDSRGQVVAHTYDNLGRKTGTFKDSVAAGNQLAGWVYDTAARGQLYTATRYVGGASGSAYTTKVTSYDDGYRPLHVDQIIPAAEGALAGTRGTDYTYKVDGALATMSVPAIGGLPSETLTYTYDSVGHATGLRSGTAVYVNDTSYVYDDLPSQRILGAGGRQVRQTYTYTNDTRRLATAQADTESLTNPGTFDGQATDVYGYDLAGNVRSVAGKSNGIADQEECFSYDYLRRMTEAYTQVSGTCTTAQKTGADAYWMSWSYDKAGNRTSHKSLNADGSTASESVYTYRSGQTHTLGSVTTTGLGAGTRDYDYDMAGNTISRPGQQGQQTLQWDAAGHLTKLTENGVDTTFAYDADGNRLVRTDPAGVKTLKLPDGTEVKYVPTSGTVVGTRYYQHSGVTVAVRKADTTESGTLTGTSTLSWVLGDHHGTGQLAIESTTLLVTRRRTMPFGELRGPATAWSGDKGFVGGTLDPSGLIHVGAREYDQVSGRFLSDDPITDSNDPQQLNGYAYGNNNPLSFSDPDGLRAEEVANGSIGALEAISYSNHPSAKTYKYMAQVNAKNNKEYRDRIEKDRVKNATTPVQLGVQWLSGTGPRTQYFFDGDPMTELLKRHENLTGARAYIRANLMAGGMGDAINGDGRGRWDYQLGDWDGIEKYLKDYSTLLTAGKTGNLATTYLGSHNMYFNVSDIDRKNSTAKVQFYVRNVSNMESATHPPVIGYTGLWSNTVGKVANTAFATGAGSPTTQYILWTETISW